MKIASYLPAAIGRIPSNPTTRRQVMQSAQIIRNAPFGERKRCTKSSGVTEAIDFHTAKLTTSKWNLAKALECLREDYCAGDKTSFNRIMAQISSEATAELDVSLQAVIASGDPALMSAMEDTTQEYMDHVLASVLLLLGEVNIDEHEEHESTRAESRHILESVGLNLV